MPPRFGTYLAPRACSADAAGGNQAGPTARHKLVHTADDLIAGAQQSWGSSELGPHAFPMKPGPRKPKPITGQGARQAWRLSPQAYAYAPPKRGSADQRRAIPGSVRSRSEPAAGAMRDHAARAGVGDYPRGLAERHSRSCNRQRRTQGNQGRGQVGRLRSSSRSAASSTGRRPNCTHSRPDNASL